MGRIYIPDGLERMRPLDTHDQSWEPLIMKLADGRNIISPLPPSQVANHFTAVAAQDKKKRQELGLLPTDEIGQALAGQMFPLYFADDEQHALKICQEAPEHQWRVAVCQSQVGLCVCDACSRCRAQR